MQSPVHILPLVILRIAFGLLMLGSLLRFLWRGWVYDFFIAPEFHFTYMGFGWVQPLPPAGMYAVFAILMVATIGIIFGAFYRLSIITFFLLFSYVELIDKATYLNHYYFISVVSLILIFLPSNAYFSVDAKRNPDIRRTHIPLLAIFVLRLQLGIVYFFAGFAKLNPDWMFEGVPLAIWLRANTGFPLIGQLFDYHWMALLMSWAGAFYDLTIPFWLSWRRIRPFAYVTVIVFHVMTGMLFNIGIFPYVMIATTLIFFDVQDCQAFAKFFRFSYSPEEAPAIQPKSLSTRAGIVLILFFMYQIMMPLRHYLYPGNTNWTMEGYNFAWRVMLNEKTGYTTFTIQNPGTGQRWLVYGTEYLTAQQMRTMPHQPDMILQFAHYLDDIHPDDLIITVEAYVAHNGRASRLIIDPTVDLTTIERQLWSVDWILRYD